MTDTQSQWWICDVHKQKLRIGQVVIHTHIVIIIIMKSRPSLEICSVQDVEQEKSDKMTHVILLVFMKNSKHLWCGSRRIDAPGIRSPHYFNSLILRLLVWSFCCLLFFVEIISLFVITICLKIDIICHYLYLKIAIIFCLAVIFIYIFFESTTWQNAYVKFYKMSFGDRNLRAHLLINILKQKQKNWLKIKIGKMS